MSRRAGAGAGTGAALVAGVGGGKRGGRGQGGGIRDDLATCRSVCEGEVGAGGPRARLDRAQGPGSPCPEQL